MWLHATAKKNIIESVVLEDGKNVWHASYKYAAFSAVLFKCRNNADSD